MRYGVQRRGARCAFSLIELLVVIAVIAVLVSLLLPAMARARESSKGIRCLANMHSVGQGVTLYTSAFNEFYPLSSHSAKGVDDPTAWLQSLQPFGVTTQDRFCPMDPQRENRLASYATNDHFEPLTAGIDYNKFTKQTLPGGRSRALNRVFLIPRPSTTVYVVEPAGAGTIDHIHSIGWTVPAQFGAAIAVRLHRGGANYLFADTHAGPIPWAEILATFRPDHNVLDPERAP